MKLNQPSIGTLRNVMSIFANIRKQQEIRYGGERTVNLNLVELTIAKTGDFVKGIFVISR